jgi:hemerythrin-like metal-binding protein
MPAIVWRDTYNVGVRSIDRQHRKIVGTLNELYDLRTARDREKQLKRVFESLRRYIEQHFAAEEAYIRKHGCPGGDEQHLEHQRFIDTVCSHQKTFLKSQPVVVLNLFNFIWDWFAHHILEVDKRCLASQRSVGK